MKKDTLNINRIEKIEPLKPLIDPEDVKKIIEMNRQIVSTNCEILKAIAYPTWVINKDEIK